MNAQDVIDILKAYGGQLPLLEANIMFSSCDEIVDDLIDAKKIEVFDDGILDNPKQLKIVGGFTKKTKVESLSKDAIMSSILEGVDFTELNMASLFEESMKIEMLKINKQIRGKFVKRVWFGIPIEKIITHFISDKKYYRFLIDGKEIALSDVEFLDSKNFRKKFFNSFGFTLPVIDGGSYSVWMTYQNSRAEEKQELKQLENEEIIVRETVKSYIENSFVTVDIKEAIQYNYVCEHEGYIIITNDIIKKIVEDALEQKCAYKRIAYMLTGLLSKSEPRKVPGVGSKRFWFFEKKKFTLKENISEGYDEDSIDR